MKSDARVRYTRMRIRKAFFDCLRKKPVSKITVKELCDMAEINRATFYKHYADPFDLLKKMEDEALEEMRENIRECRCDSRQSVLLTILSNIYDKSNLSALLASKNGDPNFAARISELFYQEFRPDIAKSLPGRSEREQNTAYLFLAGGCGHILNEWVRTGMQVPARQVAEELRKITEAFMLSY